MKNGQNVYMKNIGYGGNMNTPNVRCEDCKKELEYICEVTEIAICPKCLTVYDLKIYKKDEKI